MGGTVRQRQDRYGLAWPIACVLALAGGVLVAVEARGLTFNADDWQYVLDRRPLSAHVLFAPHLQHLSVLPILAYRLLLSTFGASSYAPFIGLTILAHVCACVLMYAVARRYIGPWAALAPEAILLTLGPAWQDLLWAFQFAYIASVATGLGAILALQRSTRQMQVLAAGLLTVSVGCSSVGLGMLIAVAVLIVFERPVRWRRLWIVGAPLALYAAWYIGYGVPDASSSNLHRVPGYVAQATAAAVASVAGLARSHAPSIRLDLTPGWFVGPVLVALVAVRRLRGGRIAPLTWAAAAAAIALWVAAALAYFPSREADQSRFQYYSVALLLLMLIGGVDEWRPRAISGAVLAGVTAAIMASNLSVLDTFAVGSRTNSEFTAAEGGAMLIARDHVSASFSPSAVVVGAALRYDGLISVTAEPFFRTVALYGSPVDTSADIGREPEAAREAADLILGTAEDLTLRRVSKIPNTGIRCRQIDRGSTATALTLRAGTVYAKTSPAPGAELRMRRLAAGFRFLTYGSPVRISNTNVVVRPKIALATGAPTSIVLPLDRSTLPWHVRLDGDRGGVLCATR